MSTLFSLNNIERHFTKETGEVFSALDHINVTIDASCHRISLIGPDGAGKTTLLKILAGIDTADSGSFTVHFPKDHELNIGYMSQNLGLYEDISVFENLKLFSVLRDLDKSSETAALTYLKDLLVHVNLWQFRDRKAGSLSGGMKQKLALTCALSSQPEILILDEPTVGVDPISRRELWEIISSYIEEHHCYCFFSSLYLEEAEKSQVTLFIKEGKIIYTGAIDTLKASVADRCFSLITNSQYLHLLSRLLMLGKNQCSCLIDICPRLGHLDLLTKAPGQSALLTQEIEALLAQVQLGHKIPFHLEPREAVLEDAYISFTIEDKVPQQQEPLSLDFSDHHSDEVVIDVQNIKKTFGNFTAVHHSNFQVHKGEIFGLLGPNGAGKTTTFRMICALLNPSSGTVLINKMSLRHAKSSVRATIGYVAQKFCLYRKMTLLQNLNYFGMSYGLHGAALQQRITELVERFNLQSYLHELSGVLPFGVQRSLAMACALIHKPAILFLDEATSGADPTSRRAFWTLITSLAQQGTTIIVTTHFMEEAEYCDRFLIQDEGKILILGSPQEICMQQGRRLSIEEVFIQSVYAQRALKHAKEEHDAHSQS